MIYRKKDVYADLVNPSLLLLQEHSKHSKAQTQQLVESFSTRESPAGS